MSVSGSMDYWGKEVVQCMNLEDFWTGLLLWVGQLNGMGGVI